MSDKTYAIQDVANWFLHHEEMTHKKLQKLCYYAQAWSLALNDSKMFNGEFEAWVHGPVNRPLWNQLKSFGYSIIPSNHFNGVAKPILSKPAYDVLESVWSTYGKFSGFDLERLSHSEKPWKEARNGLDEFEATNRVISQQTMKDYYRSLVSGDGVGE